MQGSGTETVGPVYQRQMRSVLRTVSVAAESARLIAQATERAAAVTKQQQLLVWRRRRRQMLISGRSAQQLLDNFEMRDRLREMAEGAFLLLLTTTTWEPQEEQEGERPDAGAASERGGGITPRPLPLWGWEQVETAAVAVDWAAPVPCSLLAKPTPSALPRISDQLSPVPGKLGASVRSPEERTRSSSVKRGSVRRRSRPQAEEDAGSDDANHSSRSSSGADGTRRRRSRQRRGDDSDSSGGGGRREERSGGSSNASSSEYEDSSSGGARVQKKSHQPKGPAVLRTFRKITAQGVILPQERAYRARVNEEAKAAAAAAQRKRVETRLKLMQERLRKQKAAEEAQLQAGRRDMENVDEAGPEYEQQMEGGDKQQRRLSKDTEFQVNGRRDSHGAPNGGDTDGTTPHPNEKVSYTPVTPFDAGGGAQTGDQLTVAEIMV